MCRVGHHCSRWDLHGPVFFAELIFYHLRTLELSLHWGPGSDSPAVILGVHLHPPQFAKFGHDRASSLSQIFPQEKAGPTLPSQTKAGARPASHEVSAFGDHDFLSDVSSLSAETRADRSRNSSGTTQSALRQPMPQVRRGSSCQAPPLKRCS